MSTILVIGARGKTGREVVSALLRHGNVAVRAGSRTAAVALSDSTSTTLFDWNAADTWSPALAGVDGVYLVKPRSVDPAQVVASFLECAKDVKRVVLLSEIDAENRDASTSERSVELAIEGAKIGWTIIRPNWFMQDFIDPGFYLDDVRDKGRLVVPTGGNATSFIDTRDIGEVAAACLLDARHDRQTYTLTGPEAPTWSEVAQALSDACGHEVQHLDVPLGEFLGAEAGLSEASLEYHRRIYEAIREGKTAPISQDVQEITGRSPRSLKAFVAQHRDLWVR